MKYPDGQEVRLGDKVELWPGCCGAVVASLDAGEYSAEYSEADWDYLKSGVLVVSDAAGLIHYLNPEATFVLLTRDNRPEWRRVGKGLASTFRSRGAPYH